MDYYSILGVPKNASSEQLKKAYKKQSMQHHPDRGGDESKFKEINEAYSTLKDPQKRAAYDNPQPQFNFNTSNMGGMEDIFGSMFGAGFQQQRQQPVKNRDIQLRYKITLADCFHGINTTINYKLPTGKTELVDIHIPPGCKDNDIVRISGYGDDSIRQLPRGDLILRIKVETPKNWKLENNDLHYFTDVSIFDLITGVDLTIASPSSSKINLNVPAGTQPGTTFRVAGYGIPDHRSGRTGIMYVHIKGIVPKITDPATLVMLKQLKNNLNG